MVNTDIVKFLSEIDTSIFLSFNGIHSPFWDYFMTSFTGKIIWVPMYATILYILLKNFHWKAVLCYVAAIALTITFADQMCSSLIRPGCSTASPCQPRKPDCGYGIYCQRLSWRKLWIPVMPCRQFIRSCHVCDLHIPQTLVKYFHCNMGYPQLLYPHLPGCTLSR